MDNKKDLQKIANNLEFDDFENYVNLYNLIIENNPNLKLLQKIVDYIHLKRPLKMPSILLIGTEGKGLIAQAILNSLCIEDIRELESKYFDMGYPSKYLFSDSTDDTAAIIKNIENIRCIYESILWQFLRFRKSQYFNHIGKFDEVLHFYGLMILTSSNRGKISKQIANEVDYVIQVDNYTRDTIKKIIIQRLQFCRVNVDDEVILSIMNKGKNIRGIMKVLKMGIMSMGADLRDKMEIGDI